MSWHFRLEDDEEVKVGEDQALVESYKAPCVAAIHNLGSV